MFGNRINIMSNNPAEPLLKTLGNSIILVLDNSETADEITEEFPVKSKSP
jgi:hypothetical protein